MTIDFQTTALSVCLVCGLLQPYDAAIEDEHEELMALYASLGAEKSDLAEGSDEDGVFGEEEDDDSMAE